MIKLDCVRDRVYLDFKRNSRKNIHNLYNCINVKHNWKHTFFIAFMQYYISFYNINRIYIRW